MTHLFGRLSPPRQELIILYWQGQSGNIFELEFDEAPECFACHEAESSRNRLQRAHIIARSTGGSFDPSNFVLLCAECHREAPMVTDPDIFIAWVCNHERWGEMWVRLIRGTLQKYKVPEEALSEQNLDDWRAFMRANSVRFHPHSTRREKIDTLVLMLREFLRRAQWQPSPAPLDRADEWM